MLQTQFRFADARGDVFAVRVPKRNDRLERSPATGICSASQGFRHGSGGVMLRTQFRFAYAREDVFAVRVAKSPLPKRAEEILAPATGIEPITTP